jgi:hypothetical protein
MRSLKSVQGGQSSTRPALSRCGVWRFRRPRVLRRVVHAPSSGSLRERLRRSTSKRNAAIHAASVGMRFCRDDQSAGRTDRARIGRTPASPRFGAPVGRLVASLWLVGHVRKVCALLAFHIRFSRDGNRAVRRFATGLALFGNIPRLGAASASHDYDARGYFDGATATLWAVERRNLSFG